MTLLEFVALSTANLVLIAWIIRRRGIASAEGLCMAYLGAAAITDNVALLFHYCLSPDALPLGYREFALRIYPTSVEILGLLVLTVALGVANWNAEPLNREMSERDLLQLRAFGIAVTAIGLALSFVALHLAGAFSSASFYRALNQFRDQTVPFGGFWYRGADIAVFGLALTLPSLQFKKRRLLLTLGLMMFISFFLRTNKGGLEEPLIWGAVVLFVYNRAFFRTLLNSKVIAVAIIISFLGIGAKFWVLSHSSDTQEVPRSFGELVNKASEAAAVRWGDNGLYRGYCQFVNGLPENQALFHGSRVGIYSLTSWIPRVFYPNKPDHPFRGLGFMVYSDFHSFPDETPAPMIVGSAMADHGLTSLAIYLFLAGLFLGWFRRLVASTSSSIDPHCGYMLFVLFGGFSAEEGILGLLYTFFLAYGVIVAARFIVFAKDLITLPPPVRLNDFIHEDELDRSIRSLQQF